MRALLVFLLLTSTAMTTIYEVEESTTEVPVFKAEKITEKEIISFSDSTVEETTIESDESIQRKLLIVGMFLCCVVPTCLIIIKGIRAQWNVRHLHLQNVRLQEGYAPISIIEFINRRNVNDEHKAL